MKAKFLIVTLILVYSCLLFQTKDELLKNDDWILESKLSQEFKDGKSNPIMEFYAESDKEIILDFNLLRWSWQIDGKRIYIDNGLLTGEFTVNVSKKELTLFESSIYNGKSILYKFRHPGYKDWISDDVIEYNRQQNSRLKK